MRFASLHAALFPLEKNSILACIKNNVITAMEDGVTQGVNPRDVACALAGLFEDQNSDWERLARTEMSMAAERAKLDEWEARGVDTSLTVVDAGRGQDGVMKINETRDKKPPEKGAFLLPTFSN